MQYHAKSLTIDQYETDCIIIGMYADGQLTTSGQAINKLSGGLLSQLYQQGDIKTKLANTTLLLSVPNLANKRLVVVGYDKQHTLSPTDFLKVLDKTYHRIQRRELTNVVSFLTETAVTERNLTWQIQQEILAHSNRHYVFNTYKSDQDNDKKQSASLTCAVTAEQEAIAIEAVKKGAAIAEAITLTKNLGNTPPNVCTPTYLADQAKHLVRGAKQCKINILDEAEMEKLGMNTLLAVAKGSTQPAKLICIQYQGADRDSQPIALVGKGVTFDTGGINLKNMLNMIGMKYDMCGAASLLGVLQALIRLQLPINVVIVIAAVENMPAGDATTPNTIVKSMSGKTVEILNTDAEGRLILADALTYCKQFNPKYVIDIATLTGAVVVTFGKIFSALMSNKQDLANQLLKSSEISHDRAWQLPIDADYLPLLKSQYADIANLAIPPEAGTITAGCFLAEFAKEYSWAHLDVAGTAFNKKEGATGRPVNLLMQFLLEQT